MEPLSLNALGKVLIIIGGLVLLAGVIIVLGGKVPLLGRLPGDVHICGRNFSIYSPLATSIILSLLLTVIANLFFRK